jgi:hypothetical protein
MTGRVAAALCACAVVLTAHISVCAQSAPAAPGKLLVVMTDGRVLRGEVTRHASGYFVERPGGRVLVPHEQIRCVARNLPDAYRQQREAMVDPTAATLIQLAEWCISYHLYDEAADELRRALRRDPEHEIARKMLARVQDQLLAAPAKSLERPRVDRAGLLTPEVESLGGLSKETAATFTSKIQPLLVNKCGNAGCHGQVDDNGFRLSHVRFGSANHRRLAEMNLALVMKSIDVHNPHNSQILQQIRGGHGGAPVTLFGGPQGAAQLKTLTDWVHAVSAERVAEEQRLAQRTPLKPRGVIQTAAAQSSAGYDGAGPAEPAANGVQTASFTTATDLPAPGLPPEPLAVSSPQTPQAPTRRRIDRFDPEAFNLQYATAPRSPR